MGISYVFFSKGEAPDLPEIGLMLGRKIRVELRLATLQSSSRPARHRSLASAVTSKGFPSAVIATTTSLPTGDTLLAMPQAKLEKSQKETELIVYSLLTNISSILLNVCWRRVLLAAVIREAWKATGTLMQKTL